MTTTLMAGHTSRQLFTAGRAMFSALTFALVPGVEYSQKQVEIQRRQLQKNGARVVDTIAALPAEELASCVIVVGTKPRCTAEVGQVITALRCTEQQLRDAVAAGAAIVSSALVSASLAVELLQDLDEYAVSLPPPRSPAAAASAAAGPPAKRARGEEGGIITSSGSVAAMAPPAAAAASAAAVSSVGGAISGVKRPRSSLEAADGGAAAAVAATSATAAAVVGGAGTGAGIGGVASSAAIAYAATATMPGGSGASSSSSSLSSSAALPALPACVDPAFPLDGIRGDGFGVLRVLPTAVEAVALPRGKWLNTMTDAAFAAPFNHSAGSGARSSSSGSGAAASGAGAAATPVVVPGFGPVKGSGVSIATIRAERRRAYETMTPRTMGECHVYTTPGCTGRSKVLALDMDGTLIRPTSGGKFCSTPSGWKFAFPNVASKLLAAYREGYKIVVFSNQKGISKKATTADIVRHRFENFAAKVSTAAAAIGAAASSGDASSGDASASPLVPMQLLFAPGGGYYRKPFAGMFYLLATKLNDGVPIDAASSLYVGDAAGRPASTAGTKDHSASDLQFALNCGLPFATPEAFFSGNTAPRNLSPYTAWLSVAMKDAFVAPRDLPRPTESREAGTIVVAADASTTSSSSSSAAGKGGLLGYWSSASSAGAASSAVVTGAASTASFVAVATHPPSPLEPPVPPASPELMLLVGPAATGKSFLCATAFPFHVRVNQDLLTTRAKCQEAAKAALAAGMSVVSDATNLDAKARQEWLSVAKSARVPARAILLQSPARGLSFHLNAVRAANPLGGLEGVSDRRSVPDVVIHKMYKDLDVDAKLLRSEGFADVRSWRFVPAGLDAGSGDASDAFQQACVYCCTDA